VRRFVQDQSGASAVEYGLVAAGILARNSTRRSARST